ncbi:hypothetical protein ACT4S5_13315 [Kocuria oceani]|uniref:hypothetical protein n=1 Tax=Kocuria oceani TaxID=988827 RepID=UPI004036A4ED
MATVPTFDQTITADGLTVRLHRVGEKLTVELADPDAALCELKVVDAGFGVPITTVTGLGAMARRQKTVAPLFAALDELDQATVDAVWESLHPFPAAADAHNQLWWAVGQAGCEREWTEIMNEVRESCEHRGLRAHQYVPCRSWPRPSGT